MTITTRYLSPSPVGFAALRETVGWGDISKDDAKSALEHSLFGISLYDDEQLIGMARCIGDGVFNVYIQDVIVKPNYRGKGLGSAMIRAFLSHIKPQLPAGCTIGLMAAAGQDEFYMRLGFTKRPNTDFGAGFSAQLKDLSL